ncbi:hypothetical protein C8J57DRAFT_1229711 [Mycena rebaudengoi]|nr:hypothetical protein C8J57DRAFT_1229711 [Mycena rebaudengoi]
MPLPAALLRVRAVRIVEIVRGRRISKSAGRARDMNPHAVLKWERSKSAARGDSKINDPQSPWTWARRCRVGGDRFVVRGSAQMDAPQEWDDQRLVEEEVDGRSGQMKWGDLAEKDAAELK